MQIARSLMTSRRNKLRRPMAPRLAKGRAAPVPLVTLPLELYWPWRPRPRANITIHR